MKLWFVRVVTPTGRVTSGNVEAPTERAAKMQARKWKNTGGKDFIYVELVGETA
jgi:type II secretory pathway component PulF